MKAAAKAYGSKILVQMPLGPGLKDIKYFINNMDGLTTSVGLYTSYKFEDIGYKSRDEQKKDIIDGIKLLLKYGVTRIMFSFDNGAFILINSQET